MLQLSEVIAAVRLDAKACRRRRRVSGQICAFPASIAAPADARAALPVSLPRRPIRLSRPSPGVRRHSTKPWTRRARREYAASTPRPTGRSKPLSA